MQRVFNKPVWKFEDIEKNTGYVFNWGPKFDMNNGEGVLAIYKLEDDTQRIDGAFAVVDLTQVLFLSSFATKTWREEVFPALWKALEMHFVAYGMLPKPKLATLVQQVKIDDRPPKQRRLMSNLPSLTLKL